MKIKIIFLIEGQRYDKSYINSFEINYLNLFEKGICNVLNKGDIIVFNYVGYILQNEILIFILPKYIEENLTFNEKLDEMKRLTNVLFKYASFSEYSSGDFLDINTSEENAEVSEIALAKFILEDFVMNGLYFKDTKSSILNNNGEIDWQRTIDSVSPFVIKNKPIYFDIYNIQNSVIDNIITKIHTWAIKFCLDSFGFIFGYNSNMLNQKIEIEQIGSLQTIITSVEKELTTVFQDRKISLLKALKSLVAHYGRATSKKLTLFGTTHYENIWESICSNAFGNQYQKYKQHIPKPTWKNAEGLVVKEKTFRPDILRSLDDLNIFLILDAKYYKIKFKDSLLNNPGVQDVSKQLLYEIVLKDVEKYSVRYNIFLFPQYSKDIFNVFGSVSIELINGNPIYLLYLSSKKLNEMYLANESFKEEELMEIVGEIEDYKK